MSIYTMPKSEFFGEKPECGIMILFPDNNGLKIRNNEISNVDIRLSDNLAFQNDGIYFVCGGGMIECTLDMSYRPERPSQYDVQDWEKRVKKYVNHRKKCFLACKKAMR